MCWSLWCSCIDFEFGNMLPEFGLFSVLLVQVLFNYGFRHAALLLWFLLKIRSVCPGTLLFWLFFQALDRVKLTLKVAFKFICPFVIIDPTNLGATTELLFQASCLPVTIWNLSPTQNTWIFTSSKFLPMVIKLVCLSVQIVFQYHFWSSHLGLLVPYCPYEVLRHLHCRKHANP